MAQGRAILFNMKQVQPRTTIMNQTITAVASTLSFGRTAKSITYAIALRPSDVAGIKWMATQWSTSRASGKVTIHRTYTDQTIAKRFAIHERYVRAITAGRHWPEIEPARPRNLLNPLSDR